MADSSGGAVGVHARVGAHVRAWVGACARVCACARGPDEKFETPADVTELRSGGTDPSESSCD